MASLNDVCFERIRDTFYYGMFGEFKLVVDKSTGCFNATKLCADGGKEFYNWTRLEKSKRLMAYYENRPSDLRAYEVKGCNKDALVAKTTGQYVCKELLLDIASWISVEFYDKCSRIIVDFFVSECGRHQHSTNSSYRNCRGPQRNATRKTRRRIETYRVQSRQSARRNRFERSVRRLIVGTSSVQNSSRSKQKRDASHWRKS
jgi:hypothetical protein